MTDIRLATVADGLDDLAPSLRDAAERADSATEREGLLDAAANAIRTARQLRNLIFFTTGVAGASAKAGAGPRASSGSRPGAQLTADLDGTEDHGPTAA